MLLLLHQLIPEKTEMLKVIIQRQKFALAPAVILSIVASDSISVQLVYRPKESRADVYYTKTILSLMCIRIVLFLLTWPIVL